MKELQFRIDCLDGSYCFSCRKEDNLIYDTDTNIKGLENVQGELDQAGTAEFMKCLEKAQIGKWDEEYRGDNPIEDGISWSLVCIDEEREIKSSGIESFEPYCFEYLLKAIKLCDKQLEYFGW